MVAQTFAQVLDVRLRREPGRPLVTYYDDASGERTELSVTTYANWVAKSAGVLVDDLGLEPGDTVAIALPTHWLGPVFLGAAWLAGVRVTDGPAAELVVVGPDGSDIESHQRLGCALLPFAVPAAAPLPAGVLDFGILWPGQPDVYPGVPAGPEDPALDGLTQRALLERVRSRQSVAGERVLTDLNPATEGGRDLFLDTLLGGGSVIWVARPGATEWSARAGAEHATRTVRASDPQPPRS